MTYVATEPKEQTVYMDTDGNNHASRDDALEANFKIDLQEKLFKSSMVDVDFSEFIQFVKHNNDMIRIILGDRDFT